VTGIAVTEAPPVARARPRRAHQAAHHLAAARHHRRADVRRRQPVVVDGARVTLGGYLMAGGANAVNMYLDRDIDDVMARTRLRPIPSGRMTPQAVLAFGVRCATAATWLLAQFVNVLTAALALAGFYFYVFVYTRWLKRTSPQNIVIGGAAGAFPPLVGWAAVTGASTWRRSTCSSSSSTGRRRTSGRSRCSSSATTAAPACRWRRSCGASARR
jgi:hypothetical protein